MKNLSVILAILLLTACSPQNRRLVIPPPMSSPKVGPAVVDFANMTEFDIMQAKYKSAELTCRLWFRYGKDIDKSNAPNSVFFLDLLKPSNESQLSLVAQAEDGTIEVKTRVKSLSVKSYDFLDSSTGIKYEMKYSPVAVLKSDINLVFPHSNSSIKATYNLENGVNENLTTTVLAMDPKDNQFNTATLIECTIKADVKPEYKDQFKVKSQINVQ